MTKAEELLGIRFSDMNDKQRKIYQNVLKKESRQRHADAIKERNQAYYKSRTTELKRLRSNWVELEQYIKDRMVEHSNHRNYGDQDDYYYREALNILSKMKQIESREK